MAYHHVSAMRREAVAYLNCRPGKIYVDGTLGGSGHAMAICEKIMPGGLLIGIDQDTDAVNNAKIILTPFGRNVRIFHDNFVHLPDILLREGIAQVDGILLDLGLSLHQLDAGGRGFSFQKEEPLDMRMNSTSDLTAHEIVNHWPEKELSGIFKTYGEERWAKRIARRIVETREEKGIGSSGDLARIVCDAVPKGGPRRIHPATRVFMALRIAVNRELERLETFMETAADLLNPGGRLCVLAFHSLEDRIVKQRIRALENPCTCPPDLPMCVCGKTPKVRVLTRKALRPEAEEISANPMARSTRLRAMERL